MTELQSTINVPHAGDAEAMRIAVRRVAPAGDVRPGLFWLGGFKSVMTGGKATHIASWAATQGLGVTRFDYSGHGDSSGEFADGTISRWLDEAVAVFELTKGPQILIGSSMGGFLAVLLAQRIDQRPAAIVLLAPAIDMTEQLMWNRFTEQIRQDISETGRYLRPSTYGDGPYPITRALIEDGRKHLFAGNPIDLGCPVRILHGMQDPDVPWQLSLNLMSQIEDEDVVLHLVKDGDHRLSRPQDLLRLQGILEELVHA